MIDANEAAQYAADLEDDSAPEDDNILSRITRAARELRQAEDDVKLAEEALAAAQQRVRMLKEMTLPQMMDEAGQDLLKTTDGYQLERTETLRASIPAANMPQGCMWLRSNGLGALIKRDVTLKFDKDEDQKAAAFVDSCVEQGLLPTDKLSVHPMSLAAAIREKLKEGVDVPLQLLGAHIVPTVKMKELKK